jgi:hypothetical protein
MLNLRVGFPAANSVKRAAPGDPAKTYKSRDSVPRHCPSMARTGRTYVPTRPLQQGWQPLHELRRRHHQGRRVIAPKRPQLQRHLPGGVAPRASVSQPRAGDAAAQLRQNLAVIGSTANGARAG